MLPQAFFYIRNDQILFLKHLYFEPLYPASNKEVITTVSPYAYILGILCQTFLPDSVLLF